MEMVKISVLMLFAFLVFLPKMEAQPLHHPLCRSQFALVSYACAGVPYFPLPPPQPPSPPAPTPVPPAPGPQEHKHHHGRGHGDGPKHGHEHDHGNVLGHGHNNGSTPRHGDRSNHSHGHDNDQENGHQQRQFQLQRHEHAHGSGHGHRGGEHDSLQQTDCCRWLHDLDDECVCGLLAQLPPFLSRLAHTYTVYVDSSCTTTFACQGRMFTP